MNLSKLVRKITRRSTRSATRIIDYSPLASTPLEEGECKQCAIEANKGAINKELDGQLSREVISPLVKETEGKQEAGEVYDLHERIYIEKNSNIEEGKEERLNVKQVEEHLEKEKLIIEAELPYCAALKGKNHKEGKSLDLGENNLVTAQAEEKSRPAVSQVRQAFKGIRRLFKSVISSVPMRLKSREVIMKPKKLILKPEIIKTNSTSGNTELKSFKKLDFTGNSYNDFKVINDEEHDKRRDRVSSSSNKFEESLRREIGRNKLLREAASFSSQNKKVRREKKKKSEDFYLANAGTALLWER